MTASRNTAEKIMETALRGAAVVAKSKRRAQAIQYLTAERDRTEKRLHSIRLKLKLLNELLSGLQP